MRIVESRPSPGRNAARSAVHHIQLSLKLRDVDPEMALFRAITGEEEAARAIIHSLHRHRYEGASRLNWSAHRHKAAMVPFLAAIGTLIQKGPFPSPTLRLVAKDGVDRLLVSFAITLPNGMLLHVVPDPPLDVQVVIEGQLHDFGVELGELAASVSVADIDTWIRARAAERNRFLYATEAGIPVIEGDVGPELENRRGNIFTCIAAFLLIDMFPPNQRFVLQCLPAYLKLLELLPPERATDLPAS